MTPFAIIHTTYPTVTVYFVANVVFATIDDHIVDFTH